MLIVIGHQLSGNHSPTLATRVLRGKQDMKSNNLSVNEATDVAQNHLLWRLGPHSRNFLGNFIKISYLRTIFYNISETLTGH